MKNYLPYSWPLFFASLLFVVYGSLIPLDFKAVNFLVALEQFINILQTPQPISRSDFAVNILITIPLSFSILSLIYRYYHKNTLIIVISAVFISTLISFSVEFAQIFTSGRVPSRSDVIAQFIGAMIGVVIWLTKGQIIARWFHGWHARKEQSDFFEKTLWIYIVFLFAYNVLPFDLITTPAEIYHKWVAGRIQLLPFASYSSNVFLAFYQLITDILIWVPVALLWILSRQKGRREAFFWTIRAAIILELLQLLVYSRFTDMTDIITALLGAAIGVRGSQLFLQQSKKNLSASEVNSIVDISMVLLFLWSFIIFAIYWYPYQFSFESRFVVQRLAFLYEIPLLGYFMSAPFVAITTIVQKILWFAPMGIFGGVIQHFSQSKRIKKVWIIWIIVSVIVLEFGQVFISQHAPDTSDIVLALFSVWLGVRIVSYYFRHSGNATDKQFRLEAQKQRQERVKLSQYSGLTQKNRKILVLSILFFQIASFITLVQILTQIDSIPYNIRELFSQSSVLQHLLFISAALSCVLFPLLISYPLGKKAELMYLLYPLLILASMVIFFLLLMSVPRESIYDIIGGPTLLWDWSFEAVKKYAESIGRFAVLYSSVFWCMAGAYCLNNRKNKKMLQAFYIWILLTPVIFFVSHYIIIIEAGTDNITELMRGGGGWVSSGTMFILLFILFYCTNLIGLSVAGIKKIKIKHVIVILISIPLSYWLAVFASEPMLFKYDDVFSAMQFLLSPDRTQYLSQDKIFGYYLFAYTVIMGSVIWFQLFYWVSIRLEVPYFKVMLRLFTEMLFLKKAET